MLKVSDPDSLIAVRLSGQEPFTAKDVFAPAVSSADESALTGLNESIAAPQAATSPSAIHGRRSCGAWFWRGTCLGAARTCADGPDRACS